MHVLFATSEVTPYTKTGGLADVARSLPAELKLLGVEVSIITPMHGGVDPQTHHLAERLTTLHVPVDGDRLEVKVFEGRTPDNVRIFFLSNERLFDRDPIYGPDGDTEYEDNGLRFGAFSAAVCEFMRVSAMPVDICHCNEWQTALVPVFLEERYADDDKLAGTMVLTTLHNVAYQGRFDRAVLERLGLGEELFHPDSLEFYGDVNYLKGGILYSDAITTVSPTYASEIRSSNAFGAGLEGVLSGRSEDLYGIVNGVDYALWDPSTDPQLYQRFDHERLNGKRQCKSVLQREMGLPIRPTVMTLGFIGRLVEQKGIDLISDCLDDLVDLGVQLMFLGTGERHYEKALRSWASEFPEQVSVRIAFDEALAHRLIGGLDAVMLPSRFEPCGLVQLYALRYGTVPIARATGGLVDTIEPVVGESIEGTGFLFEDFHADGLFDAVTRAHEVFNRARQWRVIQLNGMQRNFSWSRSARAYRDLYLELIA